VCSDICNFDYFHILVLYQIYGRLINDNDDDDKFSIYHMKIRFQCQMPDGKPHQIDHILVDRRSIRIYLTFDHSGQQIVIVTIIWWWQKLGRD
jgi:hypothetical protein